MTGMWYEITKQKKMHQVFLPNFVASLHRIEQDSSADNGYMCVSLVSSSTGGRVGCADQPPACVMLAGSDLTFYARKFQEKGTININTKYYIYSLLSQWSRGLRRRSAAARLLRLRVRIPPEAWMFVCCECCVLSGRGL